MREQDGRSKIEHGLLTFTMPLQFDSALMIIPQLRGFVTGVMSSHMRALLLAKCDRVQAHFERCIADVPYAEKAEFAELTVRPTLLNILVNAASQWSNAHPYYHPMVYGVDMWIDYMEEKMDFEALRSAMQVSVDEKVRHMFTQAQHYATKEQDGYRHLELAAAGEGSAAGPAAGFIPEEVPRTSPKGFFDGAKRGRMVEA